jgi:hypothetical protein
VCLTIERGVSGAVERDLTGSTIFASSEAAQSVRPRLDLCYLP